MTEKSQEIDQVPQEYVISAYVYLKGKVEACAKKIERILSLRLTVPLQPRKKVRAYMNLTDEDLMQCVLLKPIAVLVLNHTDPKVKCQS
ncbi:MAG TPA: hypothetical protein VJ894_07070 [Cryomorphaceae bacterium]|nr:hypothetical protein [Cryomorphaceae bacterium]